MSSEPSSNEVQGLRQQLASQRQALLASLLVSAWMVEARDPYTGGHLWRVARMAHALALASGSTPREASRIAMAGFLHDLGKVGIPDAILRKPGRLSDEEFATIKTHPRVGARMLAGHPLADMVVGVIHHHHEMPNGRGYPMGLADTEIPLDARLVGICDAFDAMTSTRPYRAGMPIAKALDIIESELGQQFDRALGATFVRMGRAGALDAVVGHSDEGIPLQHCPACGPTLVRTRSARAGDHLACPACAARFTWAAAEQGLQAQPSGEQALPVEMEPGLDRAQIEALVLDWADAIAGD
ncbi:HD-GYP domain-containing protein [Paucibacter sp. DJ2R-2]|uniref:HD-GYP domain-containing protein n=1 Tax=Paucibacter sp. DJ2R-2 TaxID=2893558 RepID=UPI0021E3DFDD|nr:HD domain-containing phosphohydrolase [Paucibacter sp. DJ2R-2]MCV2421797.1 HD domain-containing protein [Paucibacter sp. DJ4R-1]MCV2439586.1 HD domain-containing protein [Paucibacter sp. DJ2R-2]